ncbi:MAG: competence/damage-inducible protein A [Flavobacteriales bacterium]|nr:competence/damage-inducible protein A [Flavobacteriales bacterium]
MNLEIISIGDELLIGQTLNTNAHWIASEVDKVGFSVTRHTTVGDTKNEIIEALSLALKKNDVILITGGLGPTNDDLTMPVLNDFFGGKIIENKEVLQDIEKLVLSRGMEMNINNIRQALVPDICVPIRNKNGTAPGLWFDINNKIIVALPGVPFEMKAMLTDDVLPRLIGKFKLPIIIHRIVYTQGIPESKLAEVIAGWENNLPSTIKLAYLPSPGRVKLRLSSTGADRNKMSELIEIAVEELKMIIAPFIYSTEAGNIEEIIGKLLSDKKVTIATAESCTGGYISHLITSVSGSSDYYTGSVISYSNDIKVRELGVNSLDIEKYGAVSKQVVEQMAEGVLKKMNVDYSIAVSGIAGPTGGTDDKPVGTVWIAISSKLYGTQSKEYRFGKIRSVNIERTAVAALGMLRELLIK